MKKFALVLTLLSMMLSIVACGKELSPIEKAQNKAIDIAEQYLDYEITKEEAIEKLDSIAVPSVEGNGALFLEADIAALSFTIRLVNNNMFNETTYDDVLEKVEYMKKRDYTN